jgi:molecular chaperone GrpE
MTEAEKTTDTSPEMNNQTEAQAPVDTLALQTRLDEAQKALDGCRDQLLRKAAEFENYKRRSETEFATIIKNANEYLLMSLLPVVDDFVRSKKSARESKDIEAIIAGVEMIHTKMMKILEKQGLVPFESVGKPFDVEYHDALMQIPREDVPPSTVVEEVERGYMLNDKVLRHAKVVVSMTPEGQHGEA